MMKEILPGYYKPTNEEFAQMWESGMFVLDTNVLLNLYRYSKPAREELLAILEAFSDRVWIPHQVGLELRERRLDVISQQRGPLEDIEDAFRKLVKGLRERKHHPYIDTNNLAQRLERYSKRLRGELEKQGQEYLDLTDSEDIQTWLVDLLKGKVGSGYPPDRLIEIYKQGEERYEAEIPPGFRDKKKGFPRMYGDLVLWFQVIDKAREGAQPILFITDDDKDDWWWKLKGRTIGPHHKLVEELRQEAEVLFYMYLADQFIKQAQAYLNRPEEPEIIEEVREVREVHSAYDSLMNAMYDRLMESLSLPDISKYIMKSVSLPDISKYIMKSVSLPDISKYIMKSVSLPDISKYLADLIPSQQIIDSIRSQLALPNISLIQDQLKHLLESFPQQVQEDSSSEQEGQEDLSSDDDASADEQEGQEDSSSDGNAPTDENDPH